MQGVLVVDDDDERGAGHVVGRWESFDEITVRAETNVRLIAVDRADWEAAQTG